MGRAFLHGLYLWKVGIVTLVTELASVDPFTETQIQEGLDAVMSDRTAIVIARRLWTVRHADLYNTYFRHQSLAYIEEQKDAS